MEIISYLQGIGLPIEREGNGYKLKECPLCGHKDCFKVSPEGFFKCFSCQEGGDAFKFEALRSGLSYQEAKSKINGTNVITMPDPERDRIERNHERLLGNPECLTWLTDRRRVSLEVIKRFRVGCFTDDLGKVHYSFPYFLDQTVANIKYRTADKKMYFRKGGTEFLYNKNVLRNAKSVLIVEGEMDCLAAYSYRLSLPTISVGLGAGNYKMSWKEDLAHIQQVYIAFDNDHAGKSGAIKLAEALGAEKCRIVRLPMKDMNDCLIQGIEKEVIEAAIQKSLLLQQLQIFNAIESIPHDEPVLSDKLGPIFNMIAQRPSIETEDYVRSIRDHFPNIAYRQVLDFRNRIKAIQYHNKQAQKEELATEDKNIIPELLEHEAMSFLKSPLLFERLQETLTEVGIVGEDFNKVCLWLFFLSRKLDKPIHCVVFGQSSSGKSEMVKKVLTTIPEEDILEFTSMSARSLDYRDGDLIGKVIFIAEADGSDEVEYAIRIAMSEGKLIRGYTIKDEATGEMKNVEKVTLVKSAFVLTTTRSQIHNENNTRVFSLFADESIKQTERVLSYIRRVQSREYRRDEPRRQQLVETLRAAQRLLKPIEVEVPYAQLLEFPSNTTRNRRDLSRFISFIKVTAFLRQFQKEIKRDEIGDYVEADLQDYFLAYTYLLPILRNTLDEITPRGMTVLEVCCLVQSEKRDLAGDDVTFTVKDIQTKAQTLGIDFRNVVNLRGELQTLCEGEYLELVSGQFGAKGGRHKFRVTCQYEVEHGEVRNIRNLNTQILTPDQLSSLLKKD